MILCTDMISVCLCVLPFCCSVITCQWVKIRSHSTQDSACHGSDGSMLACDHGLFGSGMGDPDER
jgi:hypothetical protein